MIMKIKFLEIKKIDILDVDSKLDIDNDSKKLDLINLKNTDEILENTIDKKKSISKMTLVELRELVKEKKLLEDNEDLSKYKKNDLIKLLQN